VSPMELEAEKLDTDTEELDSSSSTMMVRVLRLLSYLQLLIH
jgi:hypothetical protein